MNVLVQFVAWVAFAFAAEVVRVMGCSEEAVANLLLGEASMARPWPGWLQGPLFGLLQVNRI